MFPAAVISDRAKKRIRGKYPWVFSNEIEKKPEAGAGDLIHITDREGHFVALGYYNPHTLISIRILSAHHAFDVAERIRNALDRREQIYHDRVYRLIYGESDGVPGLIVDRYAGTLVTEFLTAGIEKMSEEIIAALHEIVKPERILLRNDSPYRELEGLKSSVEWLFGEPLESGEIEVDGLKFLVDFGAGQKTGFFLDQRENRKRLAHYAKGGNMLDVFSYSGSWSIYGAKAGMQNIVAVDSSAEALEIAHKNAELNGYQLKTIANDAFQFLRDAYSNSERYDLIVLDPPAFCRSKRQLDRALRGYLEINLRAMKLLAKDGILFSCSCSQPVTPEIFLEVLRKAAADSGRSLLLKELLLQPPDHPMLINFPESQYLKCAILQLA